MTRLLIVAGLTAVIHMINTLIYASRMAGVRTKRLAMALSLFNVIFLISSTANLFQAPLLSSIVEKGINTGLHGSLEYDLVNTPAYQSFLSALSMQMRYVILAGTLGTAVGVLLIPTFVKAFSRGIMLVEEVGSVPGLLIKATFSPWKMLRKFKKISIPRVGRLRDSIKERLGIPWHFLAANVLITGIFTTGVISALYAGAMIPQYRSTATLLAGIINGIAQILFATVVDPTAAMITDQTLRGTREDKDIRQLTIYLALTRLAGTLLAQLFFYPAALIIRLAADIIT